MSIPNNELLKLKKRYPYAIIPSNPGEGNVIDSLFIRNVLDNKAYFAVLVKDYNFVIYIVNFELDIENIDTYAPIILHSPYMWVEWDSSGTIVNWIASQEKL